MFSILFYRVCYAVCVVWLWLLLWNLQADNWDASVGCLPVWWLRLRESHTDPLLAGQVRRRLWLQSHLEGCSAILHGQWCNGMSLFKSVVYYIRWLKWGEVWSWICFSDQSCSLSVESNIYCVYIYCVCIVSVIQLYLNIIIDSIAIFPFICTILIYMNSPKHEQLITWNNFYRIVCTILLRYIACTLFLLLACTFCYNSAIG